MVKPLRDSSIVRCYGSLVSIWILSKLQGLIKILVALIVNIRRKLKLLVVGELLWRKFSKANLFVVGHKFADLLFNTRDHINLVIKADKRITGLLTDGFITSIDI